MNRFPRSANLPSRLARTALALALLTGALQPGAADAKLSSLNQLFVFGDSLSDIGNAGSLSGGYFPPLSIRWQPLQQRSGGGGIFVANV